MKPHSLSKEEKLLLTRDFKETFYRGKRIDCEFLEIRYRKNPNNISRLGIALSRKVRKAVYRNRIRRILREWFRQNKASFKTGLDIVFFFREPCTEQKLKSINSVLKNQCNQYGLF